MLVSGLIFDVFLHIIIGIRVAETFNCFTKKNKITTVCYIRIYFKAIIEGIIWPLTWLRISLVVYMYVNFLPEQNPGDYVSRFFFVLEQWHANELALFASDLTGGRLSLDSYLLHTAWLYAVCAERYENFEVWKQEVLCWFAKRLLRVEVVWTHEIGIYIFLFSLRQLLLIPWLPCCKSFVLSL